MFSKRKKEKKGQGRTSKERGCTRKKAVSFMIMFYDFGCGRGEE